MNRGIIPLLAFPAIVLIGLSASYLLFSKPYQGRVEAERARQHEEWSKRHDRAVDEIDRKLDQLLERDSDGAGQ
ncbi:hypothetical protein [Sphingobium yanoikuyae]|uniref:hypothetical protein n=1 Tax=Sphingobium yanoikuyae TaxID=13690 RepID=UPI0026F0D8C4|nr:hypothetical protein [Sphingobium yanoikuyae]